MRQRQSACFTLNQLRGPIGRFSRLNQALAQCVTSDSDVYRNGGAIGRHKGCEKVRGGAEMLVPDSVGRKMTVAVSNLGL